MASTTLIFSGSRRLMLLAGLLAVIAAVLLGWGAWQIARGRRRYGLLCLAGAFGPVVAAPALLIDALFAFRAGDARRGRLSALAAGLLALACAAGLAALGWLDADPLLVGLLAGLAAEVALAVGLFYASVYASLGSRRLSALMAMRCAAILALLLVLFRPAVSRTFEPGADERGKPTLAVVLDRSASMGRADVPGPSGAAGDDRVRHDWAVEQLNAAVPAIRERFAPAWYHVAESATPADAVETLAEITPRSPGAEDTRLADALRTVERGQSGGDLAGVVLISDGAERPGEPEAGDALVRAAERLGAPVYAAGVGSERPGPPTDAAAGIRSVAVQPRRVMENHVANVKVRVTLEGLAGTPVEVRLFEGDATAPVDSTTLRPQREREEAEVELKWTARPSDEEDETGADVRRLRVEARTPREPARPDEHAAEVHALVIRPRLRVLYVEGTMRPEYKYLRRTLMTDPSVQFMSLVRVADDRFWAAPGDTAVTALPRTEEDFRRFDVLILGDIDRTFLTPDQLARIRTFVNDGGGLLMLGGHSGLGPGGYGGTPVEQALPVLLGGRDSGQEMTRFVPELTPISREYPIFEGIRQYFLAPGADSPAAGEALPRLRGCTRVERAKEGADVLAVHPTRRGADARPLVVLAVQNYGVGRSAVFTGDTTWQWYLRMRAMGEEGPHARFWAQLVRWLAAAEAKRREEGAAVLAALAPSRTAFRPGENVTARAFTHVSGGVEVATVACVLEPEDGGEPVQSPPLAPELEDDHWSGQFPAPRPGRYRIRMTARDAAGERLAEDALPLIVPEPPDGETKPERRAANLAARHDLLARAAARSRGPDGRPGMHIRLRGGPTGRADRLAEFIEGIHIPEVMRPADRGPKRVTYPGSYGWPMLTVLFLAFVGLMTGEWLLRRSWQLQ